jgi:hypothetical protein
MLLVLLASIGLSWVGVKLDRPRAQRDAVAELKKQGASAVYDYQSK